FPRQTKDSLADLGVERRATQPPPLVGPLPSHKLAVPARERLGGDDEGSPAIPGKRSCCCGEEDLVEAPKPGPTGFPVKHPHLVAKDEDLEILVRLMLAGGDEAKDAA